MRLRLRQSVGFVDLVASLAGGAVVVWVVWWLAESPMQYIGDNAQLPAVQRSHQWTDVLLSNLPVVYVVIAVVGSIAFTVYQTRFA
ncbi:hypothetical protein Hbl1158_16975 (plasmid) [Halobaculum sp. CBA1158]|uniref:hypothetical protein n=1 Tax=Halobaculum sp. CBA1158 TaxID=2904243 RepID=UPI001F27DA31|nr:hypothetical protein [Halobaculum sp. CBA1158]UIP01696.1 hypothetical protein Hbl1158_16975 [Halobaculum sp. CBA1158]